MEIHTNGSCPLCGGRHQSEYAYCTDNVISGESYSLLECKECGLVYTANAPSDKAAAKYEKLQQKLQLGESPKGVTNLLYYAAREIMLRRKYKLIKRLSYRKRGTLLNYGAKTGFFSDYMIRKNWAVTSVEKFHQERQFALELFHHRMIDVTEMDYLKENSFDVVTMWHVMEHIQNLDNMWDELYRILDDTGIAIIAVPNSKSYDAQRYGEHWAAYDVPRHLWHFTPNTIMRWGEKHNFLLERQFTMPFDGFYISALSESNKGSRLHTIKGFWNGFKGWLAQAKRRSASSSIIYVFRKRR
jgi:2-polyprenyl-3-methyl-5-hydroxy-6-metoxy-1,4-benzoquinol methylase